MSLTAVIIDDEKFIREDLKYLLSGNSDIQVINETGDIDEAKELLGSSVPDVVFLDIQLWGGTGFDLVPFISSRTHIVFITAHDEYAVRAFEVNALDYILKPITRKRLETAVEKLKSRITGAVQDVEDDSGYKKTDKIYLKTEAGHQFIPVNKLVAIVAEGGNYSSVSIFDQEKLLVRRTMKDWMNRLPGDLFMQIHRSSIINIAHISEIGKEAGQSRFSVRLTQYPDRLWVSRRMEPEIKSYIADRDTTRLR